LREAGHEVVQTREPGGTQGAEAIRALLLGVEGEGWGARAEALLFAAARADHVERLIRPALARGAWVICDRFIDSTRAYQGGGSGLSDEELLVLHGIGSGGLMPDLTLLIEVPPGGRAPSGRARCRWPGPDRRAWGGLSRPRRRRLRSLCRCRARAFRTDRRAGGCRNHPCPHHGRREPMTMLEDHGEPWREWRAALASARMHHAWILSGPKGVGKGIFARRRRRVGGGARVAATPVDHHPDILIPRHPPPPRRMRRSATRANPIPPSVRSPSTRSALCSTG
jgi:hypothetical protein